MNVRFVSQDLAWTESMKSSARAKVVEPLARHLKDEDFEVSIHIDIGWRLSPEVCPRFEMWVVLQTFDGRHNSVVRRAGSNLTVLMNEVSSGVRAQLRRPRRRFWLF